jgi:hypothetical protein
MAKTADKAKTAAAGCIGGDKSILSAREERADLRAGPIHCARLGRLAGSAPASLYGTTYLRPAGVAPERRDTVPA